MKRVAKGVAFVIVAVLPWFWAVAYRGVLSLRVGEFWGEFTVFLVAAIVATLAIIAGRKGWGRQDPSDAPEVDDPSSAVDSEVP
jgi:TM2 domain-containing membrane protein YozV